MVRGFVEWNNMSKKIALAIFGVFVILVAGGGFFWWWQDQEDVRELNKDLPEGIRVVKSLAGEYRVVNKIDGYEFKVPQRWRGLAEIDHVPERRISEMATSGFILTSPTGVIIGIDQYKMNQPEKELETLIKEFFEPEGLLEKLRIGHYEVIKVEIERLAGSQIYFLKRNSKVYVVGSFEDNDIQEVILSGKW